LPSYQERPIGPWTSDGAFGRVSSSGHRRSGGPAVRGRSSRTAYRGRASLLALVAVTALLLGCAPAAGTSSLTLATWNLEHLAARDGAGCRPRSAEDYAELRAIAEGLNADIVALQEVENRTAVARVFDPRAYDILVSERALDLQADCRGLPGQRRTALRTGFAIHRERLGAKDLRWRPLPPLRAIGLDGRRWGQRIALEAAAGGGGTAGPLLELLNLHLKSGCAWGELGPDDRAKRIRRSQCLTLRRQRGVLEEWIDARAAADQPFVILGDLNRQLDQPRDDFWAAIDDGSVCAWRADPVLGRRCRAGSGARDRDADLRLANAGRPFPYPYNPRYPYAIDHIILGGEAAGWIIGGSYDVLGYDSQPPPSDHHPIRLRLQIPEPGG